MDRSNLVCQGIFVAFEGLDGCGKTTQARMLVERVSCLELPHRYVREPGGTAVGDKIRSLLLNPETSLTPWGEAMLYATARSQLVHEVIAPALAAGEMVVCDRYLFSSLAYQGYGLELDLELVSSINMQAVGEVLPDITFLLDITPEVGLERQSSQRGLDRIERRSVAYYQRVCQGYRRLAQQHRMVVMDGTERPEALHRQVWTEIEKLTKGGEK